MNGKSSELSKSSKIYRGMIDQKVYIILLLLMVILSLTTTTFLTGNNLANLIRQNAYTIIVALSFTFILGIGDIDLSVGSAVGFGGMVIAGLTINYGWPDWAGIIMCLITCVVIGLVNAFFINEMSLPPFIVTLAMMQILRGLIYVLTGNAPIYGLSDGFLKIAQGDIFGIPNTIIYMLVALIIIFFIAKRTGFGRHIVAMGGNPSASLACGINIKKVRYLVYALNGICVGIAAIIITGRSASAQNGAGVNLEMDCIAACVIGGTSLSGGKANVLGTVAGVLIVGVVSNGLNLLRVDSNWQTVVKGLMILFSVVLDVASTKWVENSRRKKMLKS